MKGIITAMAVSVLLGGVGQAQASQAASTWRACERAIDRSYAVRNQGVRWERGSVTAHKDSNGRWTRCSVRVSVKYPSWHVISPSNSMPHPPGKASYGYWDIPSSGGTLPTPADLEKLTWCLPSGVGGYQGEMKLPPCRPMNERNHRKWLAGRVLQGPDPKLSNDQVCRVLVDASYIMSEQRDEFVKNGGNISWRQGSIKASQAEYSSGRLFRARCAVTFDYRLPKYHKDHGTGNHTAGPVSGKLSTDDLRKQGEQGVRLCLDRRGVGTRQQCRPLIKKYYMQGTAVAPATSPTPAPPPPVVSAQDKQCRAWVDASPMVAENGCHYDRAGTKSAGDNRCKIAVRCSYPDWHPVGHPEWAPGGPRGPYAYNHNSIGESLIKRLKYCLDGVFSDNCNGMTLDNFTAQYRPAMIAHIAKVRGGPTPAECDYSSTERNDVCDHHFRWDEMISKLSIPRPNYKTARDYAQSIVDKHGWANWSKMVRLIEGRNK